ncbi:MAG: hypothetical protein LBL26_04930 [Peptococcaceae bacterium]|nr:hypothetical protein [Peptococcaceae bacterium]
MAINIFGDERNCRKDNKELLQPIHFVYDKEPRDVALKQFAAFNLQLPWLLKAPADFSNSLYCWCRLWYEMHFNKKLPKEVFELLPEIKKFVENDAGAAQFVARYDEASASPAVRQAYQDWILADFRERSMRQGARDEGMKEERAIWQSVVADKDVVIADKDMVIADKDAALAEQAALIAALRAQLDERK